LPFAQAQGVKVGQRRHVLWILWSDERSTYTWGIAVLWAEPVVVWVIGLSGCRLPVSISIIVPQVRFGSLLSSTTVPTNGDHCGAYLVSRNCDLSCFFSVLVIDSKFNFL
jgi:hypothetical protein